MSLTLNRLRQADPRKKLTRAQVLALAPDIRYEDGRTKDCHRDECDINKIMARFDRTGTISHVNKFEGVYADFSDFDFFEQTRMLTRGREIFDALPAETRREFNQSPADFFQYVNDPANKDDLLQKLPALAKPGTQLPRSAGPDADNEAALAAASEPVASETTSNTGGTSPPPETAGEAE